MAIGGKRKKLIQTPESKIQGYWGEFSSRAVNLFVAGQLFVALTAAGFMILAKDAQTVFVGIVVIIVLELLVQALVICLVLQPQKRLIKFISHLVAGKDAMAEIPRHRWDEHSGLTAIASYIQSINSASTAATLASAAENVNEQADNYVVNALNITDVGIVMLDKQRRVIYRNTAAPIRNGFNNEQALDLLFNERDSVSDWVERTSKNVIKATKVWQRIPNLPDDSEERERRYYDVIANYAQGEEAEIVLAIIDRTPQYGRDEDDLNLIAFAAHELRGPVTVIRGYLDILINDMGKDITPDTKQLFDRLSVSANRLSSYISNILNTSRYDQRHLNTNLEEQTLSAIFHSIIDDVTLRASSQGRLLSIHVPDDLPAVAADISGMGEVFTNLIDNAIKYSREGGSIEVNAWAHDNYVVVDIIDHGIGMPANVVSNLFRKFYRSHRSRGSAIGTGIGLYVSKAIVEQHGGELSVRSQEGEGSTFTVTLPTYVSIKDKLLNGTAQNSAAMSENTPRIQNHGMLK
ncbi:MAG: HAMP domain-containing histidine kinase [Candidatus Nomurabacteria bacterium]|jgi:two-component system phosphate regulon sensor histidine kinase PhoR/two-component system sensor histidine kinase VicK|nr:HAMP domain-containing histidine kinase [Candidatus Nomurabacteria bacterium]